MKPIFIFLVLTIISFINIHSQNYNGKANPEAIVVSGNARFTILTPHIIRMEWSAKGNFEDHASLTFINRNLPVPVFEKNENGGFLQIKSDNILLSYKTNSGKFSPDNLKIELSVDGMKKIWQPGMENKGNLLGTTRTLDGVSGSTKLENGLLSREGWTLIDDSERPLFDNSDWPWVMARPDSNIQDWYFFACGNDYKTILKEFTEIAGKIPIPPKFAFGYWWSRYWKYTDQEFIDLVNEFKIHDVPLDVLVIDMDWHIVNRPEWYKDGQKGNDQANQWAGWTGFTWNKAVFPDPQKFLKYTDLNNIKTCLNLHPASGIQPHEDVYPLFARSMGIDPSSKKYVPFDITNKKYAQNYLDLILHPMENDGIDFWWLDWQQWSTTSIAGVNPTFYLNYVHFSDMERRNEKRPLLYHRWGGLGNHRYQIGFSGDTHINWESLDYQPYFTATASNVGYGYWSHDIGGHMADEDDLLKDPELYTRWIQWGVFSPILRTHATKNPGIERRIWAYPLDYFYVMRDAVKLRYSLIPYIYTAARKAYDSGVSVIRPMYYDYPLNEESYTMKNEYMFGDDLLVIPVTHPLGKDEKGTDNLFTVQKLWLPEGEWIEWSSGSVLQGGSVIERPFCIEDIPVYVKAGAIIPMQKDINNTANELRDYLILNIFPGDSGSVKIYDDSGNDQGYKNNEYSFTGISFTKENNILKLRINPVNGAFKGMPVRRAYELRFPVSLPPVGVNVNGEDYNYKDNNAGGSWNYDGNELTTFIFTPHIEVERETVLEIQFPAEDIKLVSGKKKLFSSMMKLTKSITNLGWGEKGWDEGKTNSDTVIWYAQTGNRITYDPSSAVKLLKELDYKLPEIIKNVSGQAAEDTKMYKPFELLRKTIPGR